MRNEDLAEAFVLFLAVGTDIDSVALGEVVGEGLLEEVEVLVEERLRRSVEAKSR